MKNVECGDEMEDARDEMEDARDEMVKNEWFTEAFKMSSTCRKVTKCVVHK